MQKIFFSLLVLTSFQNIFTSEDEQVIPSAEDEQVVPNAEMFFDFDPKDINPQDRPSLQCAIAIAQSHLRNFQLYGHTISNSAHQELYATLMMHISFIEKSITSLPHSRRLLKELLIHYNQSTKQKLSVYASLVENAMKMKCQKKLKPGIREPFIECFEQKLNHIIVSTCKEIQDANEKLIPIQYRNPTIVYKRRRGQGLMPDLSDPSVRALTGSYIIAPIPQYPS